MSYTTYSEGGRWLNKILNTTRFIRLRTYETTTVTRVVEFPAGLIGSCSLMAAAVRRRWRTMPDCACGFSSSSSSSPSPSSSSTGTTREEVTSSSSHGHRATTSWDDSMRRHPTTSSHDVIPRRHPTMSSRNVIPWRHPTTCRPMTSSHDVIPRHPPTTSSHDVVPRRRPTTSSHNIIPRRHPTTSSHDSMLCSYIHITLTLSLPYCILAILNAHNYETSMTISVSHTSWQPWLVVTRERMVSYV